MKHFDLAKFSDGQNFSQKSKEQGLPEGTAYGFFIRFDDDPHESMVMVCREETINLVFYAGDPPSCVEFIAKDGRKCALTYKKFNINDLKKIEDIKKLPPFDGIPPLSE